MGRNNDIYRIFVGGVLAMVAVAVVTTILTGECFQWIAFAAATVVLYRVVRGADR